MALLISIYSFIETVNYLLPLPDDEDDEEEPPPPPDLDGADCLGEEAGGLLLLEGAEKLGVLDAGGLLLLEGAEKLGVLDAGGLLLRGGVEYDGDLGGGVDCLSTLGLLGGEYLGWLCCSRPGLVCGLVCR